jgi:hypothetical protein
MDNTEAIKRIKDHVRVHHIGEYPHIKIAEALNMAISALANDNNVGHKWIPVSERLPDYFGFFIVAIREPYKERVGKDCANFDPFAKTWLPSMCWDKGYQVTHWMELPEPPKE